MHLAPLQMEQLRMPLPGGEANVIGLIPYQILTKKFRLKVKTVKGEAVSDPENQILKLAVFERHHASGQTGLGLVKGFGLQRGALASTIAHDSHNLIVIGASDDDMMLAARELERIGGGIAIAVDGEIAGSLALPIAGLMSKEGAETVAQEVGSLIAKAHALGVCEYYAPFLTLAFLSLPVIPELKLTDRGLVDVNAFQFVSLQAK
jgi:adenine deaminase